MDTQTSPHVPHVVSHRVPSFYERNVVALQWAIIGVAFIAACGIYWWRSTAAVEAHALGLFANAQSPEDFANIASEYGSTRAASWAKLREANGYLESGLRDGFSNREKADTDLEKARELLDSLRKVSGPKELKEQVLFAYARCLEITSDGKVDAAIEAYEALLKQYPETAFKREAGERIHALQRPEAKDFYVFYGKQHPKPAAAPRPNDEKATGKKFGSENPFEAISPGFGSELKRPADGGADSSLLPAPPSLFDKKVIPDEGIAVPDVPKLDAPEKATGKEGEDAKPAEAKEATKPAADEKPVESRAVEEKKAEEKKADEPATPKKS
jgi:tetratricopeptide (TPR) repeat protein